MKNIYVGNLNFSTTEAVLRSLFEKHGTVERVNIVTDRDTGQARGFAFVEMGDDAEAVKAINALNGTDLEGRTLVVTEARPKTDRPREDRPGGGGFGRKRW
ncbi:MAG TPA: RNA-binding protein [Bryobacteraceae bacterium]|nr:RNA-binding protein [Bryobacteraceae bacterium]